MPAGDQASALSLRSSHSETSLQAYNLAEYSPVPDHSLSDHLRARHAQQGMDAVQSEEHDETNCRRDSQQPAVELLHACQNERSASSIAVDRGQEAGAVADEDDACSEMMIQQHGPVGSSISANSECCAPNAAEISASHAEIPDPVVILDTQDHIDQRPTPAAEGELLHCKGQESPSLEAARDASAELCAGASCPNEASRRSSLEYADEFEAASETGLEAADHATTFAEGLLDHVLPAGMSNSRDGRSSFSQPDRPKHPLHEDTAQHVDTSQDSAADVDGDEAADIGSPGSASSVDSQHSSMHADVPAARDLMVLNLQEEVSAHGHDSEVNLLSLDAGIAPSETVASESLDNLGGHQEPVERQSDLGSTHHAAGIVLQRDACITNVVAAAFLQDHDQGQGHHASSKSWSGDGEENNDGSSQGEHEYCRHENRRGGPADLQSGAEAAAEAAAGSAALQGAADDTAPQALWPFYAMTNLDGQDEDEDENDLSRSVCSQPEKTDAAQGMTTPAQEPGCSSSSSRESASYETGPQSHAEASTSAQNERDSKTAHSGSSQAKHDPSGHEALEDLEGSSRSLQHPNAASCWANAGCEADVAESSGLTNHLSGPGHQAQDGCVDHQQSEWDEPAREVAEADGPEVHKSLYCVLHRCSRACQSSCRGRNPCPVIVSKFSMRPSATSARANTWSELHKMLIIEVWMAMSCTIMSAEHLK